MTTRNDPAARAGFVREARSYLGPIRQGLAATRAVPGEVAPLVETFRLVHELNAAAAQAGLDRLWQFALHFEGAVEELVTGHLEADAHVLDLLDRAADRVEALLNASPDRPPVAADAGELEEALRGLRTGARKAADAGAGPARGG